MNYLVTYQPLCSTVHGKRAILKFNYPKFIDGSCRREPDFENPFPSITSCCRGSLFAPKLMVGDKIVYLTKKDKYDSFSSHWKFVGILEVVEKTNHVNAAQFYEKKGIPIPSNCFIPSNRPLNMEHTVGKKNLTINQWNHHYKKRINAHPTFLICRPKGELMLENPSKIYEIDLIKIFGRLPGTQNPPKITDDQIEKIKKAANNNV